MFRDIVFLIFILVKLAKGASVLSNSDDLIELPSLGDLGLYLTSESSKHFSENLSPVLKDPMESTENSTSSFVEASEANTTESNARESPPILTPDTSEANTTESIGREVPQTSTSDTLDHQHLMVSIKSLTPGQPKKFMIKPSNVSLSETLEFLPALRHYEIINYNKDIEEVALRVELELSFCKDLIAIYPYREIESSCRRTTSFLNESLSNLCSAMGTRQQRFLPLLFVIVPLFFVGTLAVAVDSFERKQYIKKMTTMQGEKIYFDHDTVHKINTETFEYMKFIRNQTEYFTQGKIPSRFLKNVPFESENTFLKPTKCSIRVENNEDLIGVFEFNKKETSTI